MSGCSRSAPTPSPSSPARRACIRCSRPRLPARCAGSSACCSACLPCGLPGFYFAMATHGLRPDRQRAHHGQRRADRRRHRACRRRASPRHSTRRTASTAWCWRSPPSSPGSPGTWPAGCGGAALVAIRDSEVTAQAVGVSLFRAKLNVFVFSGITAGVAGALFASLQSYITPDTFVFELGLFFFVCIIIGGRGSIVGPFIGTVILTALPELVAPLAKLGNFFYGLPAAGGRAAGARKASAACSRSSPSACARAIERAGVAGPAAAGARHRARR